MYGEYHERNCAVWGRQMQISDTPGAEAWTEKGIELFIQDGNRAWCFSGKAMILGLRSQRGCAAPPAPPSVGRKKEKLFRDGEAGAMIGAAEDSCVH